LLEKFAPLVTELVQIEEHFLGPAVGFAFLVPEKLLQRLLNAPLHRVYHPFHPEILVGGGEKFRCAQHFLCNPPVEEGLTLPSEYNLLGKYSELQLEGG
jgi:hypothetical protein